MRLTTVQSSFLTFPKEETFSVPSFKISPALHRKTKRMLRKSIFHHFLTVLTAPTD